MNKLADNMNFELNLIQFNLHDFIRGSTHLILKEASNFKWDRRIRKLC